MLQVCELGVSPSSCHVSGESEMCPNWGLMLRCTRFLVVAKLPPVTCSQARFPGLTSLWLRMCQPSHSTCIPCAMQLVAKEAKEQHLYLQPIHCWISDRMKCMTMFEMSLRCLSWVSQHAFELTHMYRNACAVPVAGMYNFHTTLT